MVRVRLASQVQRWLLSLVTFFILLCLLAPNATTANNVSQSTVTPAQTFAVYLPLLAGGNNTDPIAQRMLERINLYRAQHSCSALVLDSQLTIAAQSHSEDMAANDFISHTGSNNSTLRDRLTTANYRFTQSAENIGAGYLTPEDLVDDWYNQTVPDDDHRQNLLNCAFQEAGTGYVFLENDPGPIQFGTYWTLVLAAPQ